jgi:hypothetical protein
LVASEGLNSPYRVSQKELLLHDKKTGIRNDLMVWRCGAMAMFRIVLMTRAFLIGPYVFMWGLQAEVETVWGVKKPPLHRDNAIPGISISALIIIAHYCDS